MKFHVLKYGFMHISVCINTWYVYDKYMKFQVDHKCLVLKPNGQIWICGDFKVSVNQYLDLTQYTLPQIEEIFERLSGGRVFSKLELPDAYLQVKLYDESKRHVVITTHRRLYRYNRLFFGLSSALSIFQTII